MLPRPPIWERSTRSLNRNDDDYDGSQRHYQNRINGNDNYQEDDDSLADHLLRSSIARQVY